MRALMHFTFFVSHATCVCSGVRQTVSFFGSSDAPPHSRKHTPDVWVFVWALVSPINLSIVVARDCEDLCECLRGTNTHTHTHAVKWDVAAHLYTECAPRIVQSLLGMPRNEEKIPLTGTNGTPQIRPRYGIVFDIVDLSRARGARSMLSVKCLFPSVLRAPAKQSVCKSPHPPELFSRYPDLGS